MAKRTKKTEAPAGDQPAVETVAPPAENFGPHDPRLKSQVCDNDQCGKPFVQSRYWQRFCSVKCRDAWHLNQVRVGKKLALANGADAEAAWQSYMEQEHLTEGSSTGNWLDDVKSAFMGGFNAHKPGE